MSKLPKKKTLNTAFVKSSQKKTKGSSSSKIRRQIKSYPKTADTTLVNQKMLYKVRDELKSDIQALEHRLEGRFKSIDRKFSAIDARFNEMEARFSAIDARFNEMEARFSAIDARFNEMEARFSAIDARFEVIESKIDALTAKVERMLLLFEEQNNRNKIVLDGLSSLFERQERLEKLVLQKET